MNIRHLQYFLSVAESLNMTKASERLHISQPALSKQIAELEQQLGTKLFFRRNRSLTLTAAGRILLSEGPAFLEHEEVLCQQVRDAALAEQHTLRLGYTGAVEVYGLPFLAQRFRTQNPGYTLDIRRYGQAVLIDRLRRSQSDIGLLMRGGGDEEPELNYRDLCRVPLCVVTSANHPLARRREIALKELGNCPILLYDEESAVSGYFLDLCRRLRFRPNVVKHKDLVESILLMVQAGFGVTILADQINTLSAMDLHSTLISDLPGLCLSLGWRKEAENPGIPILLETAAATQWSPA